MSAAVATRSDEPIHELNTTPLIDVMLVLLIMFIITIPLQTHAVDIDLPKVEATDVRNDVNKVAIDPAGAVLWNGAAIGMDQLRVNLAATTRMQRPPELQVEPHAEARYEVVDRVLAVIRRSDVQAMGFVGNERYRSF